MPMAVCKTKIIFGSCSWLENPLVMHRKQLSGHKPFPFLCIATSFLFIKSTFVCCHYIGFDSVLFRHSFRICIRQFSQKYKYITKNLMQKNCTYSLRLKFLLNLFMPRTFEDSNINLYFSVLKLVFFSGSIRPHSDIRWHLTGQTSHRKL